jgi:phage regulator Rha-like protein
MSEKISAADRLPVPLELIERRIYVIRGQKVMIDSDLAELYGVLTKNLNKAVQRNRDRFPEDFMFQLTEEEYDNLRLQTATSSLRFQIGTSNEGRGGRRYLPYAFTEHGVAMLSAVLNSDRAIQMSIVIVRAFVKLRELLATHKDLARRIEKLESGQRDHAIAISLVAKDVRNLAASVKKDFEELRSPRRRKPRIGFLADDK